MTTTKSTPANRLREARDKLRACVLQNHKPVSTRVLDRIEVKHHILPELESGLSGLFVETEHGTTFRVEFAENCDSALASGLDVLTAHQCGLISTITMTIHHDLKIEPQYLDAVLSGTKTFEIRYNDRDFKVGDTAQLSDGKREVVVRIKYISDFEQKPNYVVWAFDVLSKGICLCPICRVNIVTSFELACSECEQTFGKDA